MYIAHIDGTVNSNCGITDNTSYSMYIDNLIVVINTLIDLKATILFCSGKHPTIVYC